VKEGWGFGAEGSGKGIGLREEGTPVVARSTDAAANVTKATTYVFMRAL
jgi:hypothetical protein